MKKSVFFFPVLAIAMICGNAVFAAEKVRIGVQGAHSGDLASYGVPSLNAVKLVVDDINSKGGVLGQAVEIIAQDDQCKPEMATSAATRLISDKVAAVVGPICSGPTAATLPLFGNANMIAISPTATTPQLTEQGNAPLFFRTVAKDNAQAKLAAEFINKKLKAKKIAYLHDNGDYGKGFVDYTRGFLEKDGAETALFEAINPDATDFSAVVRKIRNEKPDIVIFGGYQPAASKLVQQMRRNRVTTPFLGPDGVKDETFLKMTGKDAEGVYATYPRDTSGHEAYKKAREAHLAAYGQEPGFGYYNAYAAMQCLLDAIAKTGTTETAKLAEALRANEVETPLGNIRFNEKGDAVGMGLSVYQVKDGKFVELEEMAIE